MNASAQRLTLRCLHLLFSIPILGYIYSPFEDLPKYASVTRFVFVPVVILSGFWMFSGVLFAVLGVAVWLGAYRFFGPGTAILSQFALFIARKAWLLIRARRPAQ